MGREESSEGFVNVPGGSVWYRIVGQGEGIPLLVLHGGPGYPSDYLEALSELGPERRVVFYDQLGCGRSERPDDTSLWTVERAVLELAAVREALHLSRVHLYGHSWGSMLAIDYALTWPEGLESLIFASPCIKIPRWIEDAKKLRATLPSETQEVLNRCEAEENLYAPEYLEATLEYYRNFVCRIDPKPECGVRADNGAGGPVYQTMWGPNEFLVTGSLQDYDRSHRLVDLSIPVLYTCGHYDEATPETTQWYQRQTPNSAIAVFTQSSHNPHFEEQEAYKAVLEEFLGAAEKGDSIPALSWDSGRSSESRIFFTLLWFAFLLIVLLFALSHGF